MLRIVCIGLFAIGLSGQSALGQEKQKDVHADARARAQLEGKEDPVRLSKTALGDLISSNKGLPTTLPKLRELLDKTYGSTDSTVVPFSGAPNDTDLEEPRMLYMSPALDLYVGAIRRLDGSVDFEFLSRNKETNRFDFGFVRDFGKATAKVEFVPNSQCIICHKNAGPIFYAAPWTNTLARQAIEPTSPKLSSFVFSQNANNSLALHVSFLKSLAKREPEWEALAKVAQRHFDHVERKKEEGEVPNFFFEAAKKRYQGADVSSSAAELELNAAGGNQVTALHEMTKRMDADTRRRVIEFLVYSGVCAQKNVFRTPSVQGLDAILKKEMLTYRQNHPVLLNSLTLSHLTGVGSKKIGSELLDPAEIEKMQAKKKSEKLRNTSPDDSPLHSENFNERSFPLFGTRFFVGVNSVVEIGESYRASLGRSGENQLKKFCDSDGFKNLTELDHLPNATEVNRAIEEWKKMPTQKNATAIKTCMECHNGKTPGTPKFGFDVSSLDEWRDHLKGTKTQQAEAQRWLGPVLRALERQTMPPAEFESHLTEVDRFALIRYLEGVRR